MGFEDEAEAHRFAARARRPHDRELKRIREQALLMGARAETLLASGSRGLAVRDSALATTATAVRREVTSIGHVIDELCLQVLSRQPPGAADLRAVTVALKLVSDLDRVTNLGALICEQVVELSAAEYLRSKPDLREPADLALELIHEAVQAFVVSDPVRAEEVIGRARILEVRCAEITDQLVELMKADSDCIRRATRLDSICRSIAAVGGQAASLAGTVLYMIRGEASRQAHGHGPQ